MTRLWIVWVTSIDRTDHAVSDDEMVAGAQAGAGRYLAMCGTSLLAAPLIYPPGARCPRCVAMLRSLMHPPQKTPRRMWTQLVARILPRKGPCPDSLPDCHSVTHSTRGETGVTSPTLPVSPRPTTQMQE